MAEDVVKIRRDLNLSQNQFAQLLGIPVGTLRNWEQKRRQPDGPAQTLLGVAALYPEILPEVVRRVSEVGTMGSIFQQSHTEFFKKTDVIAIYLFGSRAQNLEHETSDFDYAVLTKGPHQLYDDLYQKLYDIFSEISPRDLQNDVIDIVFLKNAGLELKFHVIRYGKVLYEKNAQERLNFEAQTGLFYCDYKPVLDRFDHEIVEAL